MNYRKAYCAIINHAKSEEKSGLRKKRNGNYYEAHHILPKSLFPLWEKKESNIVLLTAREHFICHLFLTKIYPEPGMFLAAFLMSSKLEKKSSKVYENLREQVALNNSKSLKGQKKGPFSEAHKEKLSLAKKGKSRGKMSLESRQKISKALKGNISDKKREAIKRNGELRRGAKMTVEQRQRISDALKGRKISEEQKKKLSEAHKGKKFSEEHKKALKEAWKGRESHITEEVRKKISEANKGKLPGNSLRIKDNFGNIFLSATSCAIFYGISRYKVYYYLKKGLPYKGVTFQKEAAEGEAK